MLERLIHYNELILNSTGEGIYGLNLQGETAFLNPAAARIDGDSHHLVGLKVIKLTAISRPDGFDAARRREAHRRARTGERLDPNLRLPSRA